MAEQDPAEVGDHTAAPPDGGEVGVRRHVGALQALQRVTGEINATLELDSILRVVLDEGIGYTGSDAGLMVLLPDGGRELRVWHGYDEATLTGISAALTAEVPGSPLAQVLAQADVTAFQGETPVPVTGCLPDAASLIVVPVFYAQQLAAALLMQSTVPNLYGDATVEFCRGLSGQAAIAIGNARRYREQMLRGEQMRRRAEQMALLLEISRTTRSDRPLDDMLGDVAYAVQEGTGFDLVMISVLEGNLLRRVACAGISVTEFEARRAVRLRWDRVQRLCEDRFRLGQCYYIPEQYRELTQDLDVYIPEGALPKGDATSWQAEDIYFVPLHSSNGAVIGVMSLDRPRDGQAPTSLTSEVVELFASQVAQTIETHRLVEDLRRQVTTLQLFNELNRSITTKLDLPLVLNTVVQSVTNLLGYDFSTVYLQSGDEQIFAPMASSGYALDLLSDATLDPQTGFVRDVVRTGMPLVVDDVPADARFVDSPVPLGSSIMVPLMVEGRPLGILTADRKNTGDFSPADVATMMALADQVTVAVENARLFEEVKRFNEELEARVAARTQELGDALNGLRVQRDRSEVLYHIASELVASLDMDRVLSQALSLLQGAIRASRSSVILLDNNTGQLVYRAAIGHEEPIPPGGRVAPFTRDDGVVGWVLSRRETLMVADIRISDAYHSDAMADVRSVMAVPVVGGAGESLGVLLFESPSVDVFDETQLQLVAAAAIQLGNALNNAQLYGMIREQAERLGTMLRTQQIDAVKNQAILEGTADGVMFADADGEVILFNAAAERILSITREQTVGRPQDEILGLYSNEVHEWMSRIAQWQQEPGELGPDEVLSHRLEVGRRYVSVHLSPVTTAPGEFLGVVSVFRDITPEIEADRAKSDFVSTVSHELRTPMTSILGYVDLMLKGAVGPLSDMHTAFLTKVKTNADRLTTLVNDLLDISRIEQGRVELQRRPVSMATLVGTVVDLVSPKVQEKSQILVTHVPDDLPLVFGDPDRLTQILTNLVSNAYKYTPVEGELSVHVYVREGMMNVAVRDTGIGISPENQKRIFERFYRVEDDPAVYEVSGTGLGLAISLSLIQMHEGSIWMESELGVGSVFTFAVPLAEGEPLADVGLPPEPLVVTSADTILVVEDDREISQMMATALEAEGYQVVIASSGEEAVRAARGKLPDFISLDIRLPDLDGFEVLQLLKRDPELADVPVVIVSVVPDRERGRALGALDFLSKPVDAAKLVAVIKRTLAEGEGVLIAHSDREVVNRLRTALQLRGFSVRTTTRGERVMRLARDSRPQVVVIDPRLPDVDSVQVLETLRHDPRTATTPVVVTATPGSLGETAVQHVSGLDNVHFVSEPSSVEALLTGIASAIDGLSEDKEPANG